MTTYPAQNFALPVPHAGFAPWGNKDGGRGGDTRTASVVVMLSPPVEENSDLVD